MNAGISEEVGQTARTFIDALKASPIALALVFMLIALLIYHFYSQTRELSTRDKNLEQLFQGQKTVFDQWSDIVRGQTALNEKLMHCMTPEDMAKVIQATKP